MHFIDNLIKLMDERGITAYQLEKDIGIKQATFGKWKKGSQPTIDKLLIILNYFQVSADELLNTNITNLTKNETELLNLFKQLPEREQIKFIGRLEDTVEKYNTKED